MNIKLSDEGITTDRRKSATMIACGLFFGFLSAVMLYLSFSSGIGSKDFYSLFPSTLVLGGISFSLLSPFRKLNFFVGGIAVILIGFSFLNSNTFWGVSLILIGVVLALLFFNKTFSNSSLRKENFLVGGMVVIIIGSSLVISNTFWGVSLILVGAALALRFFNKTFTGVLITPFIGGVVNPFFLKIFFPFIESRTFKIILKIVFFATLVIIGLLVFAGVISIISGMSATSIIIILLILIWLK